MDGKHALVLGASGITGWAIVNELLTDHPDARRFTTVTALTNRPLPQDIAMWPADAKLRTANGIDLLKGNSEELQAVIKTAIPDVHTVTHIFFNCKTNR